MKITWLGQAGLLFDNGKTKIMIDPYLSNSVEEINPKNYRRTPIDERIFSVEPNIMVFTHDHLDHYDPKTVRKFLDNNRKSATVLCPLSVWQKARLNGGPHNYVLLDRHSEWTEQGFRFCAVKAAHSDLSAIGIILEDLCEHKVYYIAGDTIYNSEIFSDLPDRIDIAFLPINGVGNNMNASDAVRFFLDCGAKTAVPYHVGMFDELTPQEFDHNNKIVLEVYKEREI